MMIGRDESMPNVRLPDLTSDERERAHRTAERVLCASIHRVVDEISLDDLALLARATQRYCPLPVPVPTLILSATPSDKTMPIAGGVLGVIEPESSDGICEPSQDSPTAIAAVDHTAMHRDANGHGFIVKRGGAERVAIPNVNHLPDHTRR
jgi:hypothetical protein